MVIKNKTIQGLKEKTNKFLKEINTWANNIKLKFTENKTEIIFYKLRPNQENPIFKMNEHRITCSQELKYLGIIITSNLKWDSHINKTIDRAKKLTYKLKSACSETFGLDRTAMMIIYNAAIRPAITYGAEIWANKLTSKQRQKINSAQRTTLIGATRAYKTTSTEALQTIANSYPLDLYVANYK